MMDRFTMVLTLTGPIYFALRERPFWFVAVWSVGCAIYWMWSSRHLRRAGRDAAIPLKPDVPRILRFVPDLAMLLLVVVAFLAVHALAYYLVFTFS